MQHLQRQAGGVPVMVNQKSPPLGGHELSCPCAGWGASQLRESTGKAVNTASFADRPRLVRSSCLQLRLIVVVCANVAESWTESAILSPPSEPVPKRLTLVMSEPELSEQEACPARVSRFCSQVLPQMT